MNLTLYHLTPNDPGTRPLYVIAPDAIEALRAAKHYIPGILKVEAVANNGYVGETFPRLLAWKSGEETQ